MEEEKVRIQDDLYEAVNGEWIAKAEIPADRTSVGGFADLDIGVEKTLMNDFKEMADGTKKIPNHYIRSAIDLYKVALDFDRRDKEGLEPVQKDLDKILALKDINDLNEHSAELFKDDILLPFNMGVEADMKNTKKHSILIIGPSTILPDTTYYADDNPQGPQLIGMWSTMVKQILAKTNLSEEDQAKFLDDTLAYDKLIAARVKSQEEWADYPAMYNPMLATVVAKKTGAFAFKKFLFGVFGFNPQTVIVADPRFFDEFAGLFNENTFELFKHWAYVNTLLSATSYLSDELRILGGSYGRALSGQREAASKEKAAYRLASDKIFSEPVGIYYGRTYFGRKAKKDTISIVKEVIATYKKRLATNTILSPATRERAILKLSKIVIKMGYPDKPGKIYDKFIVDTSKSLYDILKDISKAKIAYNIQDIERPVDRNEWPMPGHMVNACYNPYVNDITFPAAILQAPFYSLNQTKAQNLGGIGTVIGHEISHAFDNNGAQCDERGNLNNWWTEEDFKKFKELTQKMIEEFDGIEMEGGKVNGKLIVSENIADNGGVGCALEIESHEEHPDYQSFFKQFGRIWGSKMRPEYEKLLLSIDVHAPHKLRANIQPRNFAEWYEAFDVKPTDKMYIEPSKRITIW